ncbi:MAG: hypothetical protein M0R46_10485 [Candidatus Muirbacterium halophilum]|nr:hypothetical protein [Candidatus Muirbacterium halophilum]
MLYERKDLPELHFIKHLHDDDNKYIKYDEILFDKTLSPYIFQNDLMNSFLKKMQPLVALLFDQNNIIKNFKNYMVDKYHYKQK